MMDARYLLLKLKWWVREHAFLRSGLLTGETELSYELPEAYGDWAVHPCVRFIADGIGGRRWWMVLSPYPHIDSSRENILLYCGEEKGDGLPPRRWTFVREVCGTHPEGYNSDPGLFYDPASRELWVTWREWGTENVPDGCPYCCTMRVRTGDGVNFSGAEVIALNENADAGLCADTQMCPIVYSWRGETVLYGVSYVYEPYLLPRGMSLYRFAGGRFRLSESVPWADRSFDLWHFDLFEHEAALYQIVTGQSGNAIMIGRSTDGLHFSYSRRPLHSHRLFLRRNYFYKATAVVHGGMLHVFYPRKSGRDSVRIVMRSMPVCRLDKYFK